jgi:hypothetical protein
MRKVSLIILTILLCFVIQALAICPAPFQKAKEVALKAPLNHRGSYLVRMEVNIDGQEITYIIGYIPSYAQIGIGIEKDGKLTVYVYNEYLNKFYRITYYEETEILEAECISEAYKIFRIMVNEQLI